MEFHEISQKPSVHETILNGLGMYIEVSKLVQSLQCMKLF